MSGDDESLGRRQGDGSPQASGPSEEDFEALRAYEEALAGDSAGEQASGPGGAQAPPGQPDAETLAEVGRERDEYLDALRRLQAEFDNYRKRTLRQQTELLERAAEGLLGRLLPVLDALDLAVAHAASGGASAEQVASFRQIAALLTDVLAKDGLERIGAVGEEFDPTVHDAVLHVPAEAEPGAEARDAGTVATASAAGEDGDDAAREAGGEAGEAGDRAASGEGATGPQAAEDAGAEQQLHVALVDEVLRPGFRLKGRVLRPAMVKVRG